MSTEIKNPRRTLSIQVYREELEEIDRIVNKFPCATRNALVRLAVQYGMERIRGMEPLEGLEALRRHDAILFG